MKKGDPLVQLGKSVQGLTANKSVREFADAVQTVVTVMWTERGTSEKQPSQIKGKQEPVSSKSKKPPEIRKQPSRAKRDPDASKQPKVHCFLFDAQTKSRDRSSSPARTLIVKKSIVVPQIPQVKSAAKPIISKPEKTKTIPPQPSPFQTPKKACPTCGRTMDGSICYNCI